jgi:insulin-like growth factor 2 mRNA-binding protein 1
MKQPFDAFHFDLLFSLNDVSSFNMERVITIKGTIDNMSRAEGMISAKLRQSYESDLQAMAVRIF